LTGLLLNAETELLAMSGGVLSLDAIGQ